MPLEKNVHLSSAECSPRFASTQDASVALFRCETMPEPSKILENIIAASQNHGFRWTFASSFFPCCTTPFPLFLLGFLALGPTCLPSRVGAVFVDRDRMDRDDHRLAGRFCLAMSSSMLHGKRNDRELSDFHYYVYFRLLLFHLRRRRNYSPLRLESRNNLSKYRRQCFCWRKKRTFSSLWHMYFWYGVALH